MTEFVKFLSANSSAAIIFAVTALIVVLLASILCSIAFAQGRSISFWPPSIGERPKTAPADETKAEKPREGDSVVSAIHDSQSPVVGKGTLLEGASGKSYKVSSPFYGGANATLFRAEDQAGNSVIAKIYWRGLAPNSPPWDVFQQELRIADVLSHPNIVRTLDRGLRMGYPFTVMELMKGGTLRDWLQTHDRLPGRDILSIASQLAAAIDYAHSRGVVHRDIKPGNVLFESGPTDRVALSDFGIAVVLGAVERNITAQGNEFVGSPGYLAPEVVRGDDPKRESDIYSFGIVLYEMICGLVPFNDYAETLALLFAKVQQDAKDIRCLRAEVPEDVAHALAQALSRDPSLRPKTARAALMPIEPWLNIP